MSAALAAVPDLDAESVRASCMEAASKVLARGLMKVLAAVPAEAARAAFVPGGPSVDELEQRIRAFQQAHGVPV